jgi:hypothetical protein
MNSSIAEKNSVYLTIDVLEKLQNFILWNMLLAVSPRDALSNNAKLNYNSYNHARPN